jgi:WD40 repeat protein
MQLAQYHGRYLMVLPSLTTPDALDIREVDEEGREERVIVSNITTNDKGGGAMCSKLDFSKEEEARLFVGFDDGTIRIYKLNLEFGTFAQMHRLKLFPMTTTCLDYDANGDLIIAGGPQTDLVLIQNVSDDENRQIIRTNISNEGFSDCRFSPTGKIIITGGWDGKIRFFSPKSLQLLGLSNVHSDTILAIQPSSFTVRDPRRPASKHAHLFLSTSKDCTTALWSLDKIENAAINN